MRLRLHVKTTITWTAARPGDSRDVRTIQILSNLIDVPKNQNHHSGRARPMPHRGSGARVFLFLEAASADSRSRRVSGAGRGNSSRRRAAHRDSRYSAGCMETDTPPAFKGAYCRLGAWK